MDSGGVWKSFARVKAGVEIPVRRAPSLWEWRGLGAGYPMLKRGVDKRVSGWRARRIHPAVLTAFHIGEDRYGLNQLRCDLHKIEAHGQVARDPGQAHANLSFQGRGEIGCSLRAF